MIKTYGIAYLTTAVVFLCIDAVWLTVMSSRLYKPLLGPILLDNFNVKAAVLFYAIYIAGAVYFAVQPAFPEWIVDDRGSERRGVRLLRLRHL